MRAKSQEVRVTEWINFAFCMAVNFYQLVTLVEADQKVLNISGWVVNIITFIFMAVTFGYPSLIYLKKLVLFIKRTYFNAENRMEN